MLNNEQEQALTLTVAFREEYETAIQEEKMPRAVAAVWAAFELLHALLGNELIADAFGPAPVEDAPRKVQLEALAHRLKVLSHMEGGELPLSSMSLSKVSQEVRAIANGDAAILLAEFPSVQGRPINAYRLARHQLRALEWHAYLRHVGNGPAIAQNAVATAYGVTWASINRWKTPIERELGDAVVKRAIERATRPNWVDAGLWRTAEQAQKCLERDGASYQQELKRRLRPV